MNPSPLPSPVRPERHSHLVNSVDQSLSAGSGLEIHATSDPLRLADGRVVRRCSCGHAFEVAANPTKDGGACVWLPIVCPVEDALTEERAARLALDAIWCQRYLTLERQGQLLVLAVRAGA